MAKNNSWIWIVLIVIGAYFFINQNAEAEKKEFAFFCTSKEPTTLDGYKTEMVKWDGFDSISKEDSNGILFSYMPSLGDIWVNPKSSCGIISTEGTKFKNDYGIDIYLQDNGLNYIFCSDNKDYQITLRSANSTTNKKFLNLYLDNMYNCKLRALPSVSNTMAIGGGLGIIALLFILFFIFKKK